MVPLALPASSSALSWAAIRRWYGPVRGAAGAAAVPSGSPVTTQMLLCLRDAVFVALVEHPLLDLLAADQPRLAEHLQMLAAGRLAHAELLGDEQRTDPVAHQVTVALGREMPLGVTQPRQDQQALVAGQRLHQVHL